MPQIKLPISASGNLVAIFIPTWVALSYYEDILYHPAIPDAARSGAWYFAEPDVGDDLVDFAATTLG
ncbi:hypothetical protein PAPYR_7182 [Paratrimastix pyriformis]|uniref:Uncharacterized protein n=1 Tax=Paratrimastix pyriformis TaxID=342808 RepID=A0ABQ8UIW1_9EUKA|nr:hypothetical protein PAPYR_7182 [Paratrimastix pyriformis]